MYVSRWGKHVNGLKTCHETDVGQSTSVSQREKLAEERFHGHETDVRSAMSVSRQDKARQDRTEQDKTRQDKARQDRTGQNKTRQTRQTDKTDRQDWPLSEGEAEAGAGGDYERLASPEGLQ